MLKDPPPDRLRQLLLDCRRRTATTASFLAGNKLDDAESIRHASILIDAEVAAWEAYRTARRELYGR